MNLMYTLDDDAMSKTLLLFYLLSVLDTHFGFSIFVAGFVEIE
jgi:hypothetical protein